MAAGTEGFNDTSQPGKDHIGAMISKVIAARKFAREEREAAEEKAKKAGYDSLDELGVEKGFFFKAALKSKFGGSYISGKKQDIQQTVDRVKLLKNPKAQFWNFVDNRGADGKEIKKLSEVERFREQFDNYAFVSAKRAPEEVESSEEMIPDTAEETASSASGTGKSRVSREDILTAVSAIASSLEQTAQSINNTLGETKDIASGVQAIKTDVVAQLSERTDTIEAKLDAIAAAINAQTALQKKTTDDKQGAQKMSSGAAVKNAADSSDFDDLMTPEDESEESDLDVDNIPSPAATSAQNIEFQQQDAYQERETGGIVSGPDEGYLAKLHGDEMVIPIDNNYTQGQPSAMDGKVRPVPETPAIKSPAMAPKTQSFEQGTSNLGGKVGFTDLNLGMGSKSSSGADAMAQPLMDAMSLPMMVAGGTVLSSVTNLMNQLGPEGDSFAGEIAKVARPIADVFGLPNSLANKVTGRKSSKGDSDTKNKDKTEAKKKGFFSNLFEKLKKVSGRGGNRNGGGGTPVSGEASGDMKKGAEMIEAAGVPEAGAAMLAGNIQQESGWNGQRNWGEVMGDGSDRNGGLVSWMDGVSHNNFRLSKIEKYLGKPIEQATDAEQIKAMLWEMEKDYPSAHKIFMDPNATNEQLKEASKIYWGYGHEGGRFGYAEQALKHLQEGESLLNAESPGSDTPSDIAAEPGQPNSAPEITDNYGINQGQSFDFSIPGRGNYKAYKTATGFEIFKYGGAGALIGRDQRIETRDGKNAWAVKALMQAGEERVAASKLKPPTPSSGISSPTAAEAPGQTQAALQKPDKKNGASGETQVAMLNTSAAQKSAGTDKPPTVEQTVVREGDTNDLTSMFASPIVG